MIPQDITEMFTICNSNNIECLADTASISIKPEDLLKVYVLIMKSSYRYAECLLKKIEIAIIEEIRK